METPQEQKKDDACSNDFSLSLDPNVAWRRIEATQEFHDVPTIDSVDSKWNTRESDCTRIVCMSDTHGQHRDIAVPKGDVLIHAGDFTQTGEVRVVQDLLDYFRRLEIPTTICIAGNHDMTLDLPYYDRSWRRFHSRRIRNAEDAPRAMQQYTQETAGGPNQFYYLEDSSCQIPVQKGSAALSVYGSPWSPEFYDWAFNVPRGRPSHEIWSRIDPETDVLVTHGPPLGRGDLCDHGGRAGCHDLLQQVQKRVKPRLMVFGHIHEGYGTTYDGTTLYVNASNLDLDYKNVHPCTVIDLPNDPSQPPRVVQPSCRLRGEDLLPWFRENGYHSVADVMEKSNVKAGDLPSGNSLLQTSEAYKSLHNRFRWSTHQQLCKGVPELRKALLQINAESY